MYAKFYGLSTEPFSLSPDPRFCFRHPSFAKAKAYFEFAIHRREGFVVVTGRPGTGKTTLIHDLVRDLSKSSLVVARIECTQLDADDLLRSVAYAFGLDARATDKATLLHDLEALLLKRTGPRERAILIVDEAQNLPEGALEELRLITNLHDRMSPLVQIFLVGQEALRDTIRSPRLEQLHQRIVAACHIEPLSPAEMRGYIQHRLVCVGWRGDPAILGEALGIIHLSTGGIPRLVNKFCDRLLVHGSLEGRRTLTAEDAYVVLAELRAEFLNPQDFRAQDLDRLRSGAAPVLADLSVKTPPAVPAVPSDPPPAAQPSVPTGAAAPETDPAPTATAVPEPQPEPPAVAVERPATRDPEAVLHRAAAPPGRPEREQDSPPPRRSSAPLTPDRPPVRLRRRRVWPWAAAATLFAASGAAWLAAPQAVRDAAEPLWEPFERLAAGRVPGWPPSEIPVEPVRKSPAPDLPPAELSAKAEAGATPMIQVSPPSSLTAELPGLSEAAAAAVPQEGAGALSDPVAPVSVGEGPLLAAPAAQSEGPDTVEVPTGSGPAVSVPTEAPAAGGLAADEFTDVFHGQWEGETAADDVQPPAEPDLAGDLTMPESPEHIESPVSPTPGHLAAPVPAAEPAEAPPELAETPEGPAAVDEPAIASGADQLLDLADPDPQAGLLPVAPFSEGPEPPQGQTPEAAPAADTTAGGDGQVTPAPAPGQDLERLANDLRGLDSSLAPVVEGGELRLDLADLVPFGFDSAVVPEEAIPVLRELARVLALHPQTNVRIIGHTDRSGPSDYNRYLSRKRAAVVVDQLVLAGLDPARLQSEGRGIDAPMANDQGEPVYLRRIEVRIEPAGSASGPRAAENAVRRP